MAAWPLGWSLGRRQSVCELTMHWEQAYSPGQRLRALLMSVEFGSGYLDQLRTMTPAEEHPDDAVVQDLCRALIDAVSTAERLGSLKIIRGGRRQSGQGQNIEGVE